MNVLFLTLIDYESIEDSGIYTDLMREFIRNGHKIYIISPVERRKKQETRLIKSTNCSMLKLKIGNIQKTNLLEKGISTISLEREFLKAIKRYFTGVKFDLIIYSTPPITLQKAILHVKVRDGAKTYLLLKDIFPQNALDLGLMKKSGIKGLIYFYFKQREKKLYAQSDYIGCMSKANVDYIVNNYRDISPDIVEVCPNSIEPVSIKREESMVIDIRKKYNIPIDKTVLIYGGNLGKPQGIDFLIECLEANRNNDKVFFLICGSGTEYHKLKEYVDRENPENTKLFEYMAKNDYELLANTCDVGLIFLDKRFTIPNFPSRLLSYMQASMPVLAATDENTDIGRVIEEGRFGYWCKSDNVNEFNEKLSQLENKQVREEMGKAARLYLENNYTSAHSYKIIMEHFR